MIITLSPMSMNTVAASTSHVEGAPLKASGERAADPHLTVGVNAIRTQHDRPRDTEVGGQGERLAQRDRQSSAADTPRDDLRRTAIRRESPT
ncbi:hypothetical protein [Nonomuraea sp. NPDC005650]|uniref:hypothetical protein n=1 Tax=Nonomuraea sp. NPDC005650 TaxID=3157045 RepID=UPI0033B45BF8